jgi:hypothetical protein
MPKAFDRGTTDLLAKESSAPVSVPTANPGGDATSSGRNDVEARKDAARRAPIHTALEAAVRGGDKTSLAPAAVAAFSA